MAKKLFNSFLIILVILIYAMISDIQWGIFSTGKRTSPPIAAVQKKSVKYPFSSDLKFTRNVFYPANNQPGKKRTIILHKKIRKKVISIDTLAVISSKNKTKYLLRMGGKICIR